jgi:hypothetical protein
VGIKKKPFTKSCLIPLSSIISNPYVKSKSVYAYHVLTRLKEQWENSVGDKMKSFSFPYKFRDGTLYVAVTDSIWFSEIKLLKKEILEKINSVNSEVADIRFTLTDYKFTPPSPKIEKTAGDKPLSEKELNYIEETSSSIKDVRLREIFRNAMGKSLKIM